MTDQEKQRIAVMRSAGESYKEIAKTLNLSQYCSDILTPESADRDARRHFRSQRFISCTRHRKQHR